MPASLVVKLVGIVVTAGAAAYFRKSLSIMLVPVFVCFAMGFVFGYANEFATHVVKLFGMLLGPFEIPV